MALVPTQITGINMYHCTPSHLLKHQWHVPNPGTKNLHHVNQICMTNACTGGNGVA